MFHVTMTGSKHVAQSGEKCMKRIAQLHGVFLAWL
jgi:hypothetical protein